MNSQRQRRRKDRGSILAITMVILLLAGIATMGLVGLAGFQFGNAARYEIYKNEFEIAEAALARAYAEIAFLVEYAGPNLDAEIANITPPVFAGFTVRNLSVAKTSDRMETVTEAGSPWKGLQLHTIRYQINAQVHQASNTSSRYKHPGVQVRQDLELRYIPLFVFAIFYNPDLEIHPGAAMQITGRVHSNAKLYCGSDGASLKFRDYVTAVGEILHQRKPDSGMTLADGTDSFWNGSADISMKDASGWIDHLRSNWATLSLTRWSGYVYDSAHQVDVLTPPIPRLEDSQGHPDAHALIERANPSSPDEAPGTSLRQEKMEYKAGLKIVKDPATGTVLGYDQNGAPVPLTYPNPTDPKTTKSIFSQTTFFDSRENKTVSSIDVNIANLTESGKAPENGILYLSNEGADGVVRVTNASQLPTNVYNGFTVATDDPLYVKGDFNTVNKKYAMVAGDAIMLQSNSWSDANSTDAKWSSRNASNTTYNGIFFQGIVPSQVAGGTKHYSGGVENYFRMLENWTGKNLTFNGSLICVWESQKALGWWKYGSPIYTAPSRPWAWDSMYSGLNGPPGAPRVYHVQRRNWNLRTL